MEPICVECGIRKPEAFGPYTLEDSCLCLECVKKLEIAWVPAVPAETYVIVPRKQVDDPVVQELRSRWPRGHVGILGLITAVPNEPAAAAVDEELVCPKCGEDLDSEGNHFLTSRDFLDDQGVIEPEEERHGR